MAVLTNADFLAYKHALRNDSVAKAEMKSKSLTKAEWKAAMQALEDWWELGAQQLAIKTAMEAAAGTTLSNPLLKKLGKVWMQNKFGGL